MVCAWQRRAAEGIDPQFQSARANRIHVHHVVQVLDVRENEIVRMRGGCGEGPRDGNPLHAGIFGAQQFIRAILDPAGHVRVGWTAIGDIVLKATVLGRVMGRGDHDAICQAGNAPAVVRNDRAGNDRGGCDAIVPLNHGLDMVRGQHFQGGALRRGRQGMGVPAHLQRAIDFLGGAVIADGLCHGQNMGLGERAVERRAAMTAGAKGHHLIWVTDVGLPLIIFMFQQGEINQQGLGRRFAGERRR